MGRTTKQGLPVTPAFEDPDDRQPPLAGIFPEDEAGTTTEAAAAEGRVPNLFEETVDPSFPAADESAPPAWAQVPADLKIPTGTEVAYFRFKSEWTCASHKGDRTCIAWPLTDRDERVALTRVAHNPLSARSELAKQTVRAIDGMKVDWGATPGKPGCIDDFWREIGPKCRAVVVRFYDESHSMKPGELAYFFESCVALRVAG